MSNELTTQPLNEAQLFDLAQRQAKALAMSDIVPAQFKGNISNCLLAMNMAKRMNADPLCVIQNLHVIHGKPSFSSAFLIACFNQTGKFSAIRYEFVGEEFTDNWGCRATAVELATGEKHIGVLVTLGMARAEGWATKSGSKWKNLPELMLRYRAATFLIRTIAPELTMGMMTSEEVNDIQKPQATVISVNDLLAKNDEPDNDIIEGEVFFGT